VLDYRGFYLYLEILRIVVRRDRWLARYHRSSGDMASYRGIMERIKGEKEADVKACDEELLPLLDAHAKRRPEVVEHAKEKIKQHLTDEIEALDADLNSLANYLGEGDDPGKGSPKS
jgi:hypothetical protein